MAVHVLDRRAQPRARRPGASLLARLRHLDVVLVGTTLVLTGIGIVLVYSASPAAAKAYGLAPDYYLEHQIVYAVLGVVVMVVCTAVDYRRLEEWGYWVYGAAVLALVVVLSPVGTSADNAQRWIPLGPVQLQPSEFGVIGLVVAIACYVARRERELVTRDLVALSGLAAVPMLLVVKQPDLGTGIVMGVVLGVMLVIGGVRMRYLLALLSLILLAFVLAGELRLLSGYQVSRLSCFLHQNSTSKAYSTCGYNLAEAKTAIGSGGGTGVGLLRGQLTNLGYVPVAYADFIFSALGEQLGFAGCALVIGLFAVLVFRIVRAIQVARDMLGRLLCAGVLAFIAFSVFQNIGMNVGIMPITGIPLPFESYGGSALLAFYAGVGIVGNVELRRGTRR